MTVTPVVSKEAVKKVEAGLLSSDEGEKIRAAEKLRQIAGDVKEAVAAVNERQQHASAKEAELAMQVREITC